MTPIDIEKEREELSKMIAPELANATPVSNLDLLVTVVVDSLVNNRSAWEVRKIQFPTIFSPQSVLMYKDTKFGIDVLSGSFITDIDKMPLGIIRTKEEMIKRSATSMTYNLFLRVLADIEHKQAVKDIIEAQQKVEFYSSEALNLFK
jgi:hypothetical protein